MKIFKPTIKVKKFSLMLIILISLMFLFNISSVLAAETPEDEEPVTSSQNNIPQDYQLETICEYNRSKQVIHPTDDLTIILPNGSIVTKISSASIDIQLYNKTETINISDIIVSFSKINFQQSIDGLDDYNVKINFKGLITTSTNNPGIMTIEYTIDWGNGDNISGENFPTSLQVYTYKKQGTYPVIIKLIDSNGIVYYYQQNQTFKLTTAKFVELWVGENKEAVAVSSVSISGMALLGFALTETGKYKLLALLPLLIPMYTRIQKEDVLDQFVRGQIFGFIKSNPGVHYNEIMRKLDMKNGTLSYHLHMLEKTRMIKSRKEHFRYRAFYPTGMKFPKRERYRLTELQMDIIKIIKENPGINQKDIAKKLNEKHQTINYNIKVLQQAELIHLRRNGRKTSCYIFEDTSDQDN